MPPLITLDIDDTAGKDVTAESIWNGFVSRMDVLALGYSTHTHTPQAPRLRIVIPTDRPLSADEYGVAAKSVAEAIGMEYMDATAFSPEHLMFWPSTSTDSEFVSFVNDGNLLEADKAVRADQSRNPKAVAAKEQQALSFPKTGIVADFCNAYPIDEAVDTFLKDIYVDKQLPNGANGETARYTYANGSTTHGLVCYDDYAVSNHSTDIARGGKRNAFDLVRIHLFGHMDSGSKATEPSRLPSYKAMKKLVNNDERVKRLRLGVTEGSEWKLQLSFNDNGQIEKTTANILCIIENDPALSGKIWYDLFDESIHCADMPWHRQKRGTDDWSDADDVQLRIYLDMAYGLRSRQMVDDCMVKVAHDRSMHSVRDYLERISVWDGIERLDTLFVRYFGAEDSDLNRAMTRKWLAGAVSRVMQPGCQFDYCLVTSGPQGIGKSSAFKILSGKWYNGSINRIDGKEGREGLRGSWIVEFGELSALKHSDVEYIKAFITDRDDKYRPAYGRRVAAHPRQCVFCATTNDDVFLKDKTGNRRFWVVPVNFENRDKSVADIKAELEANRDQIWAEALMRYREGELLYLDDELEAELQQVQKQFHDDADDDLPERLKWYLDANIPKSWPAMTMSERKNYYNNPVPTSSVPMKVRTEFTVREFLVEAMGCGADKPNKYLARKINRLMREMPGWEATATPAIYTSWFGQQRGFRRMIDPGTEYQDSS